MIDYISMDSEIEDAQKYLDNRAFGKWTLLVDKDSSEVMKYKAQIGNLYFTLRYGRSATDTLKAVQSTIEVKGSIHKYWQNGNAGDFTRTDLENVVRYFRDTLGLDPKKLQIHAFEFGVNVETDVPPPDIFCHYVSFKNERFTPMLKARTGNRAATGVICERSEMCLKIYDKGAQYSLDRYVLRYEYKVTRMRDLQKHGIEILFLSDLLKDEVLTKLKDVLLTSYDEIVKTPQRIDNVKVRALNGKDFQLFKVGCSPEYWTALKARQKGTQSRQFKRDWKRFEDIKKQVTTDDTEHAIRTKILDKWDYLQIKHLHQKHTEITGFEDAYNNLVTERKSQVFTLILCVNYVHFRTLSTVQKERFKRRVCIHCESDILHRRSDAMTCSKKCRNFKSNAYHDHLKKLRSDSKAITLFDTCDLIDLSVLETKRTKRVEKYSI
jgi:hypothetical protein